MISIDYMEPIEANMLENSPGGLETHQKEVKSIVIHPRSVGGHFQVVVRIFRRWWNVIQTGRIYKTSRIISWGGGSK